MTAELGVTGWAVLLRWRREDGSRCDTFQLGSFRRTRGEARADIARQRANGGLDTSAGYGLVSAKAVRVSGTLTAVPR